MLPSSVEEGTLWPKAMAGVVRVASVPTTPRWLPPALSSLSKEGSFVSFYVAVIIALSRIRRKCLCLSPALGSQRAMEDVLTWPT